MPAPKTTKIVMPTKPTQGKGRRQPLPTALLILLIAIPLVLLSGIIFYFASGQAIIKQVEMTNYLQHKYSEKFVVSMPEYKNGGFAVEGIWKAQGYPVADPGLKFDVDSNSYGSGDQYVAAIWTREATPQFDKFVHSVFDDDSIDAKLDIMLSDDLVEEATKTSPSLENARTMEHGFFYMVNIVRNNGDLTNISKDSVHVSDLMHIIKNSGINSYGVKYTINTRSGITKYCGLATGDDALNARVIENCVRYGRIE